MDLGEFHLAEDRSVDRKGSILVLSGVFWGQEGVRRHWVECE
jgi:hypothetical protein